MSNVIEKNNAFSADELKLMYWGLNDLRDDLNGFMDSNECVGSDRDNTIYNIKNLNSAMRKIKNIFSEKGININSFLGL